MDDRTTPPATRFAEQVLLPLVVAFGFGVLAATLAQERRDEAAYAIAERAVDVAEYYAATCDLPWPPAALPEIVHHLEERRP